MWLNLDLWKREQCPSRASPRRDGAHLERNPDLHLQTNFGWNRQRRNFFLDWRKKDLFFRFLILQEENYSGKRATSVCEREWERECVCVYVQMWVRERERKRASRKVILNLCATHSDFLNVISSYFSGWHRPPPPLPASYQAVLLFGVRKKTAEIFVLGRNVDCFFPSITIGLDWRQLVEKQFPEILLHRCCWIRYRGSAWDNPDMIMLSSSRVTDLFPSTIRPPLISSEIWIYASSSQEFTSGLLVKQH